MRSVVAIVETRPETVLADYGRVMGLAGLGGRVRDRPSLWCRRPARPRWFPGSGSPALAIGRDSVHIAGLAADDPRSAGCQ